MEIQLLTHRPEAGWASPLPAELDSARTLVAAFAATEYADQPEFWASLATAFPRSHVMACSSAGEIAGESVGDGSAVVVVARFAHVDVTSASVPIQAVEMSQRAGQKLGRALAAAAPSLVFVLADGLQVDANELVHGIADALPQGTRIVGGLAGDGTRFQRTWTLVEGVPRSGWVSAIALSGPIEIGAAAQGGWEPFGPQRVVTRAERNVVHELDGQPALQVYKDHLGHVAARLPMAAWHFPLAVRSDVDDAEPAVRAVIAVDEHAQSLALATHMPQGTRVRLLRAGTDRLLDSAALAAANARAHTGAAVLALAISCVGRRIVLGEHCEDETAATLAQLPPGSTQAGFYAYGELAPTARSRCALHNQTMTLVTLREVAR
jgi:hypothetical protein